MYFNYSTIKWLFNLYLLYVNCSAWIVYSVCGHMPRLTTPNNNIWQGALLTLTRVGLCRLGHDDNSSFPCYVRQCRPIRLTGKRLLLIRLFSSHLWSLDFPIVYFLHSFLLRLIQKNVRAVNPKKTLKRLEGWTVKEQVCRELLYGSDYLCAGCVSNRS